MKKKKIKNNKLQKKHIVEGILSVIKYDYGFVDTANGKGIRVSRKNMASALHKDRVMAEIIHGNKMRECKIIKVLERNTTEILGEYQRRENQSYLLPLSEKINKDFKIKHTAKNIPPQMNNGDLIFGEILSYGEKEKSPTVFVSEYLGQKDKKGNDLSIVLREYGIKEKFPEEVINQHLNTEITETELAGREDFTGKTVITIDGEDAKDKDDAISLEKTEKNYILGVHIADVSHYVRSKSPIDREAYRRGTSVYLPGMVVPMLPTILSNEACSLNPDELKLTFSCNMVIDFSGKIVDYKIKKSFIKSRAALTYEIVKNIILENYDSETDKYKDLFPNIKLMHELYVLMRQNRRKNGFTDFNFPETKFELDENGKAVDVFPYETSFANEIIEEFMLAANTSVADFAMKHDLPFVYRTHPAPNSEKLQRFYDMLDVFGIKHGYSSKITPLELNKILKEASRTPYSSAIMQIALRTMQKAIYSDTPAGHYGLNFKKYCHFTSPIRRYPDLIIHRILSEYLTGNNVKKYFNSVYAIAEQSSQTEVNAFMAERDCDDIKKCEYMSEKIGEHFSGIISGMCESGFFVELSNTVEGFVSFESIRDDRYEYIEDKFTARGKKHKNVFIIGDTVNVKVKACDIPRGKINFELIPERNF